MNIDTKTTALVVIDLQKGIVQRPTAPHSSDKVVNNASKIAEKFRNQNMMVFLVRVSFSKDGADRLNPTIDNPQPFGTLPDEWDKIVPEIGPKDNDYIITKRQWGAFYGTDLALQLQRRGIKTIVLTGISTNFGVESTARTAFELGYKQIFVEDAMSSFSEEAHKFPVNTIFPRIGIVRTTNQILEAIYV